MRHAEVHNPKDIVYGRLPRFGLSANGRRQASMTARFVAARGVQQIYTSPLLRARQTAAILADESHVTVRRAHALLEVRTSYQGHPNSILKPGFSFYEPRHMDTDESMEDVFARVHSLIGLLVRRHAGQTIAVVSHGDPIAILRVGLEGRPLTVQNLHATVYPTRASVTQVIVGPGSHLELGYFNVAETNA